MGVLRETKEDYPFLKEKKNLKSAEILMTLIHETKLERMKM